MEDALAQIAVVDSENTHGSEFLTQRLKDQKGNGRPDSLKIVALDYVVGGSYEAAKREIDIYIDTKTRFPEFMKKAHPFRIHALDLISAIETKRHLPGLASLTFAKQQEIHDRVLSHFEELKRVLKQIESLNRSSQLDDVKSTVWFLKIFSNAVLFLVGFAFFVEISTGLGYSMNVVFNSLIEDLTDLIFSLF